MSTVPPVLQSDRSTASLRDFSALCSWDGGFTRQFFNTLDRDDFVSSLSLSTPNAVSFSPTSLTVPPVSPSFFQPSFLFQCSRSGKRSLFCLGVVWTCKLLQIPSEKRNVIMRSRYMRGHLSLPTVSFTFHHNVLQIYRPLLLTGFGGELRSPDNLRLEMVH